VDGKHGKVKIIDQSSYNTIVQRISGIKKKNGRLLKKVPNTLNLRKE